MIPVVATVAAVASTRRQIQGGPGFVDQGYGAMAHRRPSLPDAVYQSFFALPEEAPCRPEPASPRCTLGLSFRTRQIAPSLLFLGGSALCLTVASYEVASSLYCERPPYAAVASLIGLSTGLNLAALISARRIGSPEPEPENIVD